MFITQYSPRKQDTGHKRIKNRRYSPQNYTPRLVG